MLNGQKKKEQKNLPKIQTIKFHYSFNNFIRGPLQVYTWILGSKSDCVVSEEMSFETFTPIWSHVNENEKKKKKKIGKNPKFEISQFLEQLW